MAYSPLGIGLLSGTYDPKNNPSAGSLWNKPERTDHYSNLMKGRTPNLIESVRNIAKTYNATPAQVALSWVLSHPEISVAISGADKEEQMRENVEAVNISLTEDEINQLDKKSKGLKLF